jgi:hypothetical protein
MNISASALQRGGHKQLKMASSSFSTTPSPSVLASRPVAATLSTRSHSGDALNQHTHEHTTNFLTRQSVIGM